MYFSALFGSAYISQVETDGNYEYYNADVIYYVYCINHYYHICTFLIGIPFFANLI